MTCQCFPFEDSGVVLLMLMSLQVMSGVVLCHEDTKDICMVAQGLWAHVWQRWTGGGLLGLDPSWGCQHPLASTGTLKGTCQEDHGVGASGDMRVGVPGTGSFTGAASVSSSTCAWWLTPMRGCRGGMGWVRQRVLW